VEFESTVIGVELALKRILPEWQRLHRNMGLSKYVIKAQEILDHHKGVNDMSVLRTLSLKLALELLTLSL
jgi:hypothetical protein